MSKPEKFAFGFTPRAKDPELPAPSLAYRPIATVYPIKIGLIGAGGIAVQHLTAYSAAGYDVAAICDVRLSAAEELRDRFYPNAVVFDDYRRLLAMPGIDVADITTHPDVRHDIIRDALSAGKHVLSQKPFTTDLDRGEELCRLAEEKKLKLAVNHNARWAPHFRYAALLVREGYVGSIQGCHFNVAWDHTWIRGTPFENIRHCVLFDFAIHWFDMVTVLMNGERAARVFASTTRSAGQDVKPDLLGQAAVEFASAQATLTFEGDSRYGLDDRLVIIGSEGAIFSEGANSNEQTLRFMGKEGVFRPVLKGAWFPDGFHGSMAELLSSIAEGREPENSGRSVLKSLELCFAAVASADAGTPFVPGTVRALPV